MSEFEVWCTCKGTGVVPAPAGDEIIYAICVFCDGAGVIQIKGDNMEEQEQKQEEKQPFAYEEYVELKKTYQEVRDRVLEQRAVLNSTINLVRDFFQDRYAYNDYSDDFHIDIEDINALLRDIKATPLSKEFDANATIELTIKVHAESQDDADVIIRDHLDSIDWNFYNDSDEIEVESIDVHVSE